MLDSEMRTTCVLHLIATLALALLCQTSIQARSASWQENIEAGDAARQLKRFDEAERWYRAALKDADKFKFSDWRLRTTLEKLTDVAQALGKHSEAEPLYARLIANAERVMKANQSEVMLGRNERTLGRIESESGIERLNTAVADYGIARYLLTRYLKNLAGLYQSQKRSSEAEQTYLKLIAVMKKALDDAPESNLEHLIEFRPDGEGSQRLTPVVLSVKNFDAAAKKEKLAEASDALAALYLSQAKFSEAEALFQQSLSIRGDAPDSINPKIAATLGNLAILHASQGRFEQAEPLFRRALDISERALGPAHPQVAGILENYAILLRKTGRAAEAEAMLSRARSIRQQKQD